VSVPVSKRNENQTLKTLLLAMDLAYYTIKICCNENVFSPKYKNAVTDDLIRLAKDIYINLRTANGIKVETAEDLKLRAGYQLRAKADCDTLIAELDIAKRVFHLSSRRVVYWASKTMECREYIMKWRESDVKRFKERSNIGM
jgi:hypothetical protein